ncbi:unnamed protein product [Bursaphelenchus xylophilus]|uniref:(pine wood nematode) hypothetical protein n=1 Tax=Bursaphelenchus xylophilus TaxID=6326 RepID=A0A1I7RJR4_BURXY|nr:unnamed protein product [Bursaphelenchus xylophilus]CAG9129005.1 unnamed protein product [Bursaphelenchus xylophilus]
MYSAEREEYLREKILREKRHTSGQYDDNISSPRLREVETRYASRPVEQYRTPSDRIERRQLSLPPPRRDLPYRPQPIRPTHAVAPTIYPSYRATGVPDPYAPLYAKESAHQLSPRQTESFDKVRAKYLEQEATKIPQEFSDSKRTGVGEFKQYPYPSRAEKARSYHEPEVNRSQYPISYQEYRPEVKHHEIKPSYQPEVVSRPHSQYQSQYEPQHVVVHHQIQSAPRPQTHQSLLPSYEPPLIHQRENYPSTQIQTQRLIQPSEHYPRRVGSPIEPVGNAHILNGPDAFAIRIPLNQFPISGIKITRKGNSVTVKGTHVNQDNTGQWVKRTFSRTYTIPQDCVLATLRAGYNGKTDELIVKGNRLGSDDSETPIPIEVIDDVDDDAVSHDSNSTSKRSPKPKKKLKKQPSKDSYESAKALQSTENLQRTRDISPDSSYKPSLHKASNSQESGKSSLKSSPKFQRQSPPRSPLRSPSHSPPKSPVRNFDEQLLRRETELPETTFEPRYGQSEVVGSANTHLI